MAYYNKQEVKNYIIENNVIITNKAHKPITPMELSVSQLENEEDVVGFFWMDINEKEVIKVKLNGKTFIRIDFDLYTDDRFAVDLLQSQQEQITVSQVIKNRLIDQDRAKKSISETKEQLENSLISEKEN